MSQNEKLIKRFKNHPVDFTWDELIHLLSNFRYELHEKGKAGDSRGRFVHPVHAFITLHEPHPEKVLKRYHIDQIIEILKEDLL